MTLRLKAFCMLLLSTITCVAQPTRQQVGPQAMPQEIAPITAPFEMPQLKRPVFPQREVIVKMSHNGLSTKAIQKAIDQMAEKGGGTVTIPAGDWQTGRITLRSNINLHLAEGCRLNFSGQIADYQPVVFTRDEGIEIYSLGAFIYANGERNIAVTGKGEIIGPSIDCEIYQQNKAYCLNIEKIVGDQPLEARYYDGVKTKEVFLPKTIAPIDCSNVLIEGVTLTQGLYWNVVPQYCDSVIIRGVTVNSFGHGRTDGIDIESSRNVLIEYCSLDCQDDCYTMKSGRGWDGLRVNRPTENVVVRHSLALRGAGGIVGGTEMAGFVRNVYTHDCVFDGTDQAFRVKSRRTRGGGIENLFVERVRANVKYAAFYCDLLGEIKWMGELAQRFPTPPRTKFTPYFHDISVHDVLIEGCRELISYTGQPELPVKNVFFGNATVTCQRIGHVQDVTGFSMKDVSIHSQDNVLTIDGCSVVNIFGVNNVDMKAPVKVEQKGEPSKYVSVQEVPMEPVVYDAVHPGGVWLDTEGKPIQAHGFQITCIDDTYYWYGENKADALLGTTKMFGGVRCYSSKDFYNWKDEGLILAPDTVNPLSPIHYSQKLERPHIIRNPRTGKYVLWAKSQAEDGYFAIFQADRFMGPYTFVRNLQPEGYGVGDFDMYVDEQTGKGYVWFERPHWELICADLTDDFLNVTETYSKHFVGQKPPFTREAPAHFMANGKHYLFTSGTTGYTSNPSEVAVFDDYHGEYHILGDPHVGDSCASSFNSQITGVIKIPNKNMWVALADRWEPHTTGTDFARRTFEAKKGSYANYKPQAQKPIGTEPQVVDRRYKLVDMAHAVYHAGYVFLPITFENGIPKIHWQDKWRINEKAKESEVTWDKHSLMIDGKRVCPVMGEVHYSRIPADEWADEVRKMKEGGVTVIATYVFWNHIEEQEGIFRWDGQRDLRRFIEICQQEQLPVVLRLGPFCHGEVRNGGIPDWVFTKGCKTRDENPVFLGMVENLYRQIFTQVQGLQWKDGGPVIAAQFDNEYRGRGEYLMALKKIATKIGFDLPFYTRTGWPELTTPVPFGEMLPLYGDYADGFWERSIEEAAGNYYKAFNFSASQVSGAIGSEQLDYSKKATTNNQYPYFTCELGGGMMTAYHRRPYIYPEDAYSMAIVKLGSGSNLLGYYMYHGGTNPEGLTYLNETQRTIATNYNDLPVKTYDFQAPLNEFGQKNPQYYMLRKIHLFMQDWGDMLAPMEASFPCKQDIKKGDDSFLRWSVRSKDGSGFIFINNYERLQNLSAKKGIQLEACEVKLPKMNIPAGTMCILPVNIDGIKYATAQLIAKRDGKIFLEQIKGIPTTIALGNKVLKNLKAKGPDVPVYQNYYLLTSEQAERLFLNEEGHHDIAYKAPVIKKIKEAGPLRQITIGVNKAAEEPVDEDFEQAAVYTIDLSSVISHPSPRNPHLLLNIDYRGDVARLYADGKLIDDNFYNGRPFQYALWRLPKDCHQLELRILPLQKDMPVYFPREADTTPGEEVKQVTIIHQ